MGRKKAIGSSVLRSKPSLAEAVIPDKTVVSVATGGFKDAKEIKRFCEALVDNKPDSISDLVVQILPDKLVIGCIRGSVTDLQELVDYCMELIKA